MSIKVRGQVDNVRRRTSFRGHSSANRRKSSPKTRGDLVQARTFFAAVFPGAPLVPPCGPWKTSHWNKTLTR
jgi:hypothetical protein